MTELARKCVEVRSCGSSCHSERSLRSEESRFFGHSEIFGL